MISFAPFVVFEKLENSIFFILSTYTLFDALALIVHDTFHVEAVPEYAPTTIAVCWLRAVSN
ncbi:hypothetical protein EPA93_42075 [Ktedonosporobacter rubrisoli]|uniref:Uncharacterized protein n=1 Tax=Ktedonosporobacter rubrisoli TaxID=2509675 RepID=A0A4P6K396_KTERU|nr:hypothetical protein [Ktedonosporobacter rubrisoli]QBD82220.1 hypothetical protein EPA93_42075 [Ktedonosporobacter rubrisoli]